MNFVIDCAHLGVSVAHISIVGTDFTVVFKTLKPSLFS